MLSKRSFFGLLITLVIIRLGVQQQHAPNQEIVVQFTSQSIDTEEVESVVTLVKNQLKSLGVDQLSVVPSEKGQLIITYYSSHSTETVKNSLATNDDFFIDESNEPQPEVPSIPENTYRLSVSDLHQHQTFHLDAFVVETPFENPAVSFPDVQGAVVEFKSTNAFEPSTEPLGFPAAEAQLIRRNPFNVPPVRAGPKQMC